MAAYLWAVLRYWEGELKVWPSAIVFGVLFCVHLSVAWFIPAFLMVPLVRAKQDRNVSVLKEVLCQFVVAGLVIGVFFQFVAMYAYGGSWVKMWEFFNSIQVMRVGADAAMFHPWEVALSWQYYETLLNVYPYLIISAVVLLPAVVMGFKEQRDVDAKEAWVALLAGGYLIYSLLWNPDRPYPSDWDIFSGLSIPLMLWVSLRVEKLKIEEAVKHVILYQVVVFSWMYTGWIIVHNHLDGLAQPLYQ